MFFEGLLALLYRYIYRHITIYLSSKGIDSYMYCKLCVRSCVRARACKSYANTSKSALVMLYSLNLSLNQLMAEHDSGVLFEVNAWYRYTIAPR